MAYKDRVENLSQWINGFYKEAYMVYNKRYNNLSRWLDVLHNYYNNCNYSGWKASSLLNTQLHRNMLGTVLRESHDVMTTGVYASACVDKSGNLLPCSYNGSTLYYIVDMIP